MTHQLHLIDAPTWSGTTTDLLRGHRTVGWRVELLDKTGRTLRDISQDVTDLSVEFNVNATIRSGGSCTYRGKEPVDWTVHRLRIHYLLSHHGADMEWPVGTFIVESPTRTLTGETRQAQELDLYDLMYRLEQQASTAGAWVARKGENIIDRVRYLLGRQSMVNALEDSDATFASDMVWPAGTPYLRMVNDMLEAANFFSVWADPMGVLRSTAYRAPAYRGVAYTFSDTTGGLPYADGQRHNRDTFNVPNQVVLIAESDDPDKEPMTATATDTSSPYGVKTTGMVRTVVQENVKAADQARLNALAVRRLEEQQRVSSTLEFEHLPVPVAMNDVVRVTRVHPPLDMLAVVEKTAYGSKGPLAKTTVREVQA